ncbi:30S ribosomal protein S1 [Geodia barretti]|uniref:30S ribosomal protein S1 n=1 Tax=Geodia barretti TaxID=519541 RepID=A0AA35X546_GEOBA|nr:30S ribosomal protein S1 [Geodia barretti]
MIKNRLCELVSNQSSHARIVPEFGRRARRSMLVSPHHSGIRAFVRLGGFDGLLHVNDMRWGHVASPRDLVEIGQTLTVKIIRLDRETQKVNLSLKHLADDPVTTFDRAALQYEARRCCARNQC